VVVLGPGSLFTSVIPNLLVPAITDALNATDALRIYVCNVMTQPGETDNFTASDHVRAIEAHTGKRVFDYVLVNTRMPSAEMLERYRASGQDVVIPDVDRVRAMGYKVVTGDFISESDFVRHDPIRLGGSHPAPGKVGGPSTGWGGQSGILIGDCVWWIGFIVRELLPPLLFGVGLFTTLIFAGGYVFMIYGVCGQGHPTGAGGGACCALSAANSGQDAADGDVAGGAAGVFGRLSSDWEITALRAAGVSVYRLMMPVFWMGLLVRPAGDWLQRDAGAVGDGARECSSRSHPRKVAVNGAAGVWVPPVA
jgi:hypothetical protein